MNTKSIYKALTLSSLLSASFVTSVYADGAVSDTLITTKVKSQIALSHNLPTSKVQVTTEDGIVHLKGKVDSETQAETLVELAQATTDVIDVDAADLEVAKSSQPITDSLITAKIKGLYIREQLVDDADVSAGNISVETNNGIVFLKGAASNQLAADTAIIIAKTVQGVKDVKSDILVGTAEE